MAEWTLPPLNFGFTMCFFSGQRDVKKGLRPACTAGLALCSAF